MQTAPNKYSQIFMTAIGLILLIMALVLNHKHPHNQGVATVPRNNIYNLSLKVSQAVAELTATNYGNKPSSLTLHQEQSTVAENNTSTTQASIVVADVPVAAQPTTPNCTDTAAVDISQDTTTSTNHSDKSKKKDATQSSPVRTSLTCQTMPALTAVE